MPYKKSKVCLSLETIDGFRCVDIFQRKDNTYGFEEFRRDVEDPRGWFPIGYFASMEFSNEDEAIVAAKNYIYWFRLAYKNKVY